MSSHTASTHEAFALAARHDAGSDAQPRALCIDIEASSDAAPVIHKLAAFRADTDTQYASAGKLNTAAVRAELDALARGAAFVLGHNIRAFDLPLLQQHYPGLALFGLPVVDTLELSALAFPQNPYHALVKDYKLIREERNDPLLDARASLRLFADEIAEFRRLSASQPAHIALLHYLLVGAGESGGLASVFQTVRRAQRPNDSDARDQMAATMSPHVCTTRLTALLVDDLNRPELHRPLAHVLAWLRVAGAQSSTPGNSVLPAWVRHTYPVVSELIESLRERACGKPECRYCSEHHDPTRLLRSWFDLPAFRPLPANAEGGSLQRDIVLAGLRGQSLLAILPTGGGKSLCYQLPALERYWRSGKLTVIVSPLQSLMKDQVDGLMARGITCAITINGLLTPPERGRALEQLRMGDAGIVLVSPEQFRSRAFTEALACREVATWVFDEAHCLSRWGHDFRTDYLYVSRYIREHFSQALAPIACFTATAKPDVVADLQKHFADELGVSLALFGGGHARANLDYHVLPVRKAEKPARVLELLREELRDVGSAIVFAGTRAHAEQMAEFILEAGWSCAFFHGGLEAGRKRAIQQAFIDGQLRVMVATNAFGMGVDKRDVRLVIHADVPGSLENYLQEAGRAGRDGEAARCVLLYDEDDIEAQFRLSSMTRLTHADFARMLKALRGRQKRLHSDDLVLTPRELLMDVGDDDHGSFDIDAPDADTRVRTAIAWLERHRYLRREQNSTRVFPASLRIASLDEARAKLDRAQLTPALREQYERLLGLLLQADSEQGVSTDEVLVQAGIAQADCFGTLHALEALGLISNDLGLRVILRKGVVDPSQTCYERRCVLERVLLDLMRMGAPDAEVGESQVLTLRTLCTQAAEAIAHSSSVEALLPDTVLDALRAMSAAFDDPQGPRHLYSLRRRGDGQLSVTLRQTWAAVESAVLQRQAAGSLLLAALLARLPAGLQSASAAVECRIAELLQALQSDMAVGPVLRDGKAALEQALLHLHDTGAATLDRGRTIFRAAMTLHMEPGTRSRRFTKSEFEPLRLHYEERNFQIHVIQEYAQRGLRKIADALALVAAYFSQQRDTFIEGSLGGRRELLEFAATAESFHRIVDALSNPDQQRLVTGRVDANHLVLAGPGSGKTRVIVHRVAYLVRVLRVPADSIIVLAFNRSAAFEVRRRLHELIGRDATGVTVLTYHAMALRLTGISLSAAEEQGKSIDLDDVLRRAIELLRDRGDADAASDESSADDLRERLLRGYRYILVDEYQDIDALQYELVSALAGRSARDDDAKLAIMAVGDDDQNIYEFRGANVEYVRRYAQDYRADSTFLVENYRSTAHIIAAANAVIAPLPGRMKQERPIQIDYARRRDPRGGRWEAIDQQARGRVQVITTSASANVQAQVVLQSLRRLQSLDPALDWSNVAIIAATHQTLQPVRAACESAGIPARCGGDRPAVSALQTREGSALLQRLTRRGRVRLVRAPALSAWVAGRRRASPLNPWWTALDALCAELALLHGRTPVSASYLIEALYEGAAEQVREGGGSVNLLTAHGAKGRQFDHVLLLDAGDWRATEAARRVYYVAMTRAKQTLRLYKARNDSNPFVPELIGSDCCMWIDPATEPEADANLNRRHFSLTPGDVDIGYAGAHAAEHPIHGAIARLQPGEPLTVRGRLLLDNGVTVGKLAAKCALPKGRIVSATVSAIVPRTTAQSKPEYRGRDRVSHWEVVLADVVFETAAQPTKHGSPLSQG